MIKELRPTLVLTDNIELYNYVYALVGQSELGEVVDFGCSANGPLASDSSPPLRIVDVRREAADLMSRYAMVISLHSKQMFPSELVRSVRCINIHPGYNPETRGWFPQVFSIIHGLKLGITVHVMDSEVDHGDIIYREEIPVLLSDTSLSAYRRIIAAEERYLRTQLKRLVCDELEAIPMETEGNVFRKRDFDRLCEIDLDERGTFRDFYDRLRALTFDGYRNAYIRDPSTQKKIFLALYVESE